MPFILFMGSADRHRVGKGILEPSRRRETMSANHLVCRVTIIIISPLIQYHQQWSYAASSMKNCNINQNQWRKKSLLFLIYQTLCRIWTPNGISLGSHRVPGSGSTPVWKYLRTCESVHTESDVYEQCYMKIYYNIRNFWQLMQRERRCWWNFLKYCLLLWSLVQAPRSQ